MNRWLLNSSINVLFIGLNQCIVCYFEEIISFLVAGFINEDKERSLF